jgi:serine phosphatase RsbU (regulator of sigma subunit)
VLRSYAYEGASPSVVLDRLDRLVQAFEMAQAATCAYGRLQREQDQDGGGRGGATLLLANAGHPPPFIRDPDGSVRRADQGTSPLIGALEPGSVPRTETTISLPPGSLLVLYTDGLIESRDRDIDTGLDLLASTLAALDPGTTPDQVCDALLAGLVPPGYDDDVAVLAVRIDEQPQPRARSPVASGSAVTGPAVVAGRR